MEDFLIRFWLKPIATIIAIVKSVVLTIAAFTPVWIYLILRRWLFLPAGFWQELTLFVVAFLILITPQIFLVLKLKERLRYIWNICE